MATSGAATALSFLPPNSIKSRLLISKNSLSFSNLQRTCFSTANRLSFKHFKKINGILCSSMPFVSTGTTHYEFSDGDSEVELRLELGKEGISPREIFIDANENSLLIRVQQNGYNRTLLDTNTLYGMIKPSETIWYIDDDQLVINLKQQDPELKWPDIMESWESLTMGVMQLLKGTSIYLVGESTDINHKIAQELAVGLGYTPLSTKEILESYSKQTIELWVASRGSDAVAEAESSILESLSSHARAVVSTLGGQHGAAGSPSKWRHLFAGFTVWLSQSDATDEESAKEDAQIHFKNGLQGYSNAEVVVKLGGWDPNYSKTVAQASLSALKRLILSARSLPGKKSLYIRLRCQGDWPGIKPHESPPPSLREFDYKEKFSRVGTFSLRNRYYFPLSYIPFVLYIKLAILNILYLPFYIFITFSKKPTRCLFLCPSLLSYLMVLDEII